MEVRLPRLGEGADSGSVSTIFVKEGDVVKKDQPILELESEKAVASIPSPATGTITKIHVREGDEIKVGQVLVTMSEDGVPIQPSKAAKESPQVVSENVSVVVKEERVVREVGDEAEAERLPSGVAPAASPSIRKMARELGIDLSRVKGSERGGRIVLADLRRYIQRLQQSASGGTPQALPHTASLKLSIEAVDFSKWGPTSRQRMSQLRKAISKKMVESWTTVPHVTQFADADITELITLRKKYAPLYERKGAHLTLTAFILKALVPMLKKYPKFNCSLDEVTEEIVYKDYYHLGVAVDTDQGLIVPVLRDVDKKSLLEISVELHTLAERTRQRKVSLEELQGGTFTVSNQGGIGGAHFTPIINKPEVAVLGVGQGRWTAVPNGKKADKRMLLPLGLSYDHRVIDGADAAKFITAFVSVLEHFSESDVAIGRGRRKGKK
jgi:pyruvate dehydrogenase E2 component (dihydrolipoamide acetyltransferase)